MSESIFGTFTDERGNISVRISQEVQVLTREEANRIEAEYRRMQAENAKLREEFDKMDVWHSKELTAAMAENEKLRELVEDMLDCIDIQIAFERVPARWMREEFAGRARELRIEVDDA